MFSLRPLKGRLTVFTLIAVLLLQLAACGTILYPERRGQRSGTVDIGVAVLDGIGVVLFVIPGLIAYAIDFSTGAIYLPGGSRSSNGIGTDLTVINVPPAELTPERIRQVVLAQTGVDVDPSSQRVLQYSAKYADLHSLAQAINSGGSRLAFGIASH